MSIHAGKMTASIQYIRKLLGKSSCTTYNLFNTAHKTQRSKNEYKITKKSPESPKQNVLQSEDKTAEQCIRKSVVLRRKENETFGFDIQPSSDGRTVSAEQDLSLCVCCVQENSPARSAGLTTGDVIITVNSVCVAGLTPQQVTDLMQQSSMLKMEIIRNTTVKQRQLLVRYCLLQRELSEKCEELEAVITQEMRLSRGASENHQSPSDLHTGSSATLC